MITSKDNELIKKCVHLKSKKYSRLDGLCLVESIKLVKELYALGYVKTILATNSKMNLLKSLNTQIETISDSIASHLSDTVTTDGVFAICSIPKTQSVNYKKCLILDRIQDPSNLGAIIRSACAFGFDTILTLNSVYPYTMKAIRSSMGYVFKVNFIEISFDEIDRIKKDYNLLILTADMKGELIDNVSIDKSQNIAIIIGNEGQGVDDNLARLSDKTISIAMKNNVESLNAGVSAGILMYYLR